MNPHACLYVTQCKMIFSWQWLSLMSHSFLTIPLILNWFLLRNSVHICQMKSSMYWWIILVPVQVPMPSLVVESCYIYEEETASRPLWQLLRGFYQWCLERYKRHTCLIILLIRSFTVLWALFHICSLISYMTCILYRFYVLVKGDRKKSSFLKMPGFWLLF